jgi:RNA polymerase-binding transcription factor DksA
MIALQLMKGRLEAELNELRGQIAELDEDLEAKPDYTLGAGDPAVYQWEYNLAQRERAIEKLHAVQAALQRLAEGSYGQCLRCRKEIEAERLELLPSTPLCAHCAQTRR